MKTKLFVTTLLCFAMIFLVACGQEESGQGHRHGPSLWIDVTPGGDLSFREEVMSRHNTARMITADSENYTRYSENELSKMSEFYCLANVNFDGFELKSASISPEVFFFSFSAVEPDDYGYINIHITRPEMCGNADEVFDDYLSQIRESIELTKEWEGAKQYYKIDESGMLYSGYHGSSESGLLFAKIGNAVMDIQTFATAIGSDYTTLRDLARQVIDSAELVQVQ